VHTVATELLGQYLVRRVGGKSEKFLITEVEAYDGERDLACHASKGRTKRTEVLYGKPGTLYVYLCYGMYNMLNVVTDREDYPAAVLIRGVESVSRRITGPGRLTRDLTINRNINALPAGKKAGVWFEESSIVIWPRDIEKTQRIGVDYAGDWAAAPLRFVVPGDPHRSRR
jgi:DNA-3-methyladenine glycosylase